MSAPPKRQSENMQGFQKSAEQSPTETGGQSSDVTTLREATAEEKRQPLFTPHADS